MILSLTSSTLSDDVIQALTFDLCGDLRRELAEDANVAERSPIGAGAKGDSFMVGTIVLSLIGSGGVAVTLINLLKSYIDRGHNLKIRLKTKSGERVDLEANNLRPEQIEQTTKLIERILSVS
jgi:hypothetical protein